MVKSRIDRIYTGCSFVASLIKQKKMGTSIFETAISRLKDLLVEEIKKDEDYIEEKDFEEKARKIFTETQG